ncbi:hypothetical protein BDV28DRAFT_51267 [Aspergillus coremiiformis]|uniref:Uncharacterized protein n=1 Tax=Aspergillus coremiiformis TaxID=138285 RepID=A0A5N6ZCB5_9EURO|nr:hypothetical protein BDV28DRAFT_51267 [Aspergillus coremiiformis]
MSGLPHLHGRQHVQHAQPSSLQCDPENPAPYAPANNQLDSTNAKQNSGEVSGPCSSIVRASVAVEPASEYTLHVASSQASNLTSQIDVASHSQTESLTTEYSTGQTFSSPTKSQMRPRYTQITGADATERKQTESKRLVSSVHNNGSTAVPEPPSPSSMTAGHKRTATGFIKPSVEEQPYSPSTTGIERRCSNSISSATHGNKIAALSVHLRTRLSYAAAKVEASRRAQSFRSKSLLDLRQCDRSSSIPAPDMLERIGRGIGSQGPTESGSPDAINSMSAPDTSPKSRLYSLNDPMRLSPTARSEDSPSLKSDLQKSRTPFSSIHPISRLAPPPDIIPRSDSTRRRRLNPNEPTNQPKNAPYHRHRRHNSQQSMSTIKRTSSSETVFVPATPPLRPLPYEGLSSQPSHSQNSSMEQDAIETLLFMSSPGHSGYGSNSQPSRSQPHRLHRNITSTQTKPSAPGSQSTNAKANTAQPPTGYRGPSMGLEAQAGDEIDRLLDEMDSDSEDEKNYPSSHSNSISTGSTPGGRSQGRNPPFRSYRVRD